MRRIFSLIGVLALLFVPVFSTATTTDFVIVHHTYDFDPHSAGSYALQAHCPSDRPVVTGGGYIPATDMTEVSAQYPQNASPNLWKAEINLPDSGDSLTSEVIAVCTSGTVSQTSE